jgi:hypothetical protein
VVFTTLPEKKKLSLTTESALRYGINENKLFYTTVNYLEGRLKLTRLKLGVIISSKPVLLGMAGLGERMHYGPQDRKVLFITATFFTSSSLNLQFGGYWRWERLYPNQNTEFDLGLVLRNFPRTLIFIYGTVVDYLTKNKPVFQTNFEVRYVI